MEFINRKYAKKAENTNPEDRSSLEEANMSI
jgi:hypothetical protein